MRHIFGIISVLAVSLAGSTALAQGSNYIVVSAMYSSALDSDYNVADVTGKYGMKGGGGFLMAYGHRFDNGFAIETEFSTKSSKATSIKLDQNLVVSGTTVPAGTYPFPAPIKVTTTAFMANGVFRMGDVGLGLRPFFGAGIGLANAKVHDYTISDGANDIELDGGTGGATAYQFLGGVAVPISESMSVRVGYRYFATGNFDLGSEKIKTSSHNFEIGAEFTF